MRQSGRSPPPHCRRSLAFWARQQVVAAPAALTSSRQHRLASLLDLTSRGVAGDACVQSVFLSDWSTEVVTFRYPAGARHRQTRASLVR
eukprot:344443-Prymnesium_polylepis.1